MVSIVDASVAGNLRSTCSYLLDHIDAHLDALGPKVIDLAEHEVAGRNESYVPSWADDLLALVAGLGVRFPWAPKAVHIPDDRHLCKRPMLERSQTELADHYTIRYVGTEADALDLIHGGH